MSIIYICRNKINNKIYIGQTKQTLYKRIHRHLSDALSGRSNVHFHRAIRKYGKENFEWNILQTIPDNCNEALNAAERWWIEYYDSYNYGYNSTTGGSNQYTFNLSENAKNKIRNYRLNYKAPEWVKEKLSKAHTGVKLSKEHIEANAIGHYKKILCVELNIVFDSVKDAA